MGLEVAQDLRLRHDDFYGDIPGIDGECFDKEHIGEGEYGGGIGAQAREEAVVVAAAVAEPVALRGGGEGGDEHKVELLGVELGLGGGGFAKAKGAQNQGARVGMDCQATLGSAAGEGEALMGERREREEIQLLGCGGVDEHGLSGDQLGQGGEALA